MDVMFCSMCYYSKKRKSNNRVVFFLQLLLVCFFVGKSTIALRITLYPRHYLLLQNLHQHQLIRRPKDPQRWPICKRERRTRYHLLKSDVDSSHSVIDVDEPMIQATCDISINNYSLDDDDDDDDLSDAAIVTSSSNAWQRNTVLTMTVLVATLSALDRVAMSVAILPMATEYGLTDTMKGQISSVFTVGYGLGIIPAGMLVSFISPKVIMACGVFLWSLATLLTPWAASYLSITTTLLDSTAITATIIPLLVVRAIMGLSESVVLPTIQRILFTWVPPEKNESSIAVATVFGGFQLGTIIAYALSPYLIDWWDGSWKGIFYVYGTIGAVWLLPWLLFVPGDSSSKNKMTKQNGFNHKILQSDTSITTQNNGDASSTLVSSSIANGDVINTSNPFQNAPWKAMFASKGVWAMIVAHAANNWGLYINLAWAPTFYQEQYHLNVRDSALFSILPSVAGAMGGVLAGTVADNLLQKGLDRTLVRKVFQGLALFGPAICLALLTHVISTESSATDNTPFVAQSLLTCAVGLQSFNAAGYGASAQEKAGDKWAGLVYGVTSLPGVILGSIAVYAAGQMLDAGLGWNTVFGVNVMVDLIGATCFVAWYDSKKEFD